MDKIKLLEVSDALLGSEYVRSWQALEVLVPQLNGFAYDFMDPGQYQQLVEQDPRRGAAVYWREMLHRAHWAGASSLIRTHRWLSGTLQAFDDRNLIVFSACIRGLLESSADTWDALGAVAITIAAHRPLISDALDGRLHKSCVAEDLENRLIHFTFARNPEKGVMASDHHRAKRVSAYLEHFEQEQPSIRKFYTHLCDLVHPGARSILSFVRASEQGTKITLSLSEEDQHLTWLGGALRLVVPEIMAGGFNTGVLILKTLNAFPVKEVHTPAIDKIPLLPIPAWRQIQDLLR